MHVQFTEITNGTGFGMLDRHAYRVDPGGPVTPAATRTPTSADAAERAAAADKPAEKPAPTPAEKAAAAIKDGKITDAEKGAVTTTTGKEKTAAEQARLGAAVNKTLPGYARDEKGQLELSGGDEPWMVSPWAEDMSHSDRVADLKDKPKIQDIDASITKLKDAGVTSGVKALEDQKAARAGEEAKVVDVIKDKTALVGSLEAEKTQINEDLPDTAANDYQKLREQAMPHIRQFLENDGQEWESDVFGDDWDSVDDKEKYDKDPGLFFDRMVGQLHGTDEIKNWAAHQGDSGDHLNDEEMQKHIADKAGDDPAEAAKIAARYEATQELQKIMEQYEGDRKAVEGAAGRIKEIDAEVGVLNESIKMDREALSTSTSEALDEELAGFAEATEEPAPAPEAEDAQGGSDGHIPGAPPYAQPGWENPNGDPRRDNSEAGSGSGGNGGGEVEAGGPVDNGPHTEGGTNNGGSGNGTGNDPNGNPDEVNGGGAGGAEATEGRGGDEATTRTEKVDYDTPEQRQVVLAKAQEQGYLPADGAKFNDQGQAVVTVNRENGARGYWGIAESTAGPQGITNEHWQGVWNSNAERLGRNTSPEASQFIGVGDELVIPGRSVDELVALLNLPREREVEEAATPPHMQRSGGNVPY